MADNINYTKIRSDNDGSLVSVGTILPWSQATAPTGFLKCDGSAVSRSTYSDLFSVIGTTYGSGDGSTTFNLPDLQSRNLIGANTSTNVGQTSGAKDTTGAGFSLQNNLQAQNTQNLVAVTQSNLTTLDSDNLSLQNAQNLSLQTTNNLAASLDDTGVSLQVDTAPIAVAAQGSVSSTTLSLAQITSHNHPGGAASSNNSRSSYGPPNNPPRGIQNAGGGLQNLGSGGAHTHGHNIAGSLQGSVTTNLQGNVTGSLTGDVSGQVQGNVTTNLQGGVTSSVQGNLSTQIQGTAGANLSGDVTIQNASLYQPHVVVIYIIKT